MRRTAGAEASEMRMPPVTGPSSMVMRVAPWKRALARVTSPSSSPRSSGTIIFCAAKYGALNAPSAKVTASSTASDRCPDQWTIGITAIRGPRAVAEDHRPPCSPLGEQLSTGQPQAGDPGEDRGDDERHP